MHASLWGLSKLPTNIPTVQGASAEVYLFGAHVTSWKTTDQTVRHFTHHAPMLQLWSPWPCRSCCLSVSRLCLSRPRLSGMPLECGASGTAAALS